MPNNLTGLGTAPPAGRPTTGAAFVRTFYPREATWLKAPPGMRAISQSGKYQTRTINRVGATWVEIYGILHVDDPNVRAWFDYLNQLYRHGVPFTITHPHAGGAMTCILEDFQPPKAGPDEYYVGMQLAFREVVP